MFDGFTDETFAFLRGLEANNNRDWFQAHRDAYDNAYVAPARQLVSELGPRLREHSPTVNYEPKVNRSIFRINRDVRFSKDKTPYNPHLDLWFWEGEERGWDTPGYFFRLAPKHLTLGAGMHRFDRPLLQEFREVVVDDGRGATLDALLSSITTSGPYTIGGATREKVPRGWDADHVRAALLLHEGLFATAEGPHPAETHTQQLVDYCAEHYSRLAPLHHWLLELRAKVPAAPARR